jgi:hypothetical protein
VTWALTQRRSLTVARRLPEVPIYPLVIVLAFILDIWRGSALDGALLIRPMAVGVSAAAVLSAVTISVLGKDRGALVAGLVAVAIIGGDDLRIVALAGASLALMGLLFVREDKLAFRAPWSRVTRLLNVIALVTIAILGWDALSRFAHDGATSEGVSLPPLRRGAGAGEPPDILILLLDAHGRQDLLQTNYGEDISAFVRGLELRGFDVSPRSRTNYMSTRPALTAMFNAAHLSRLNLPHEADPALGPALKDRLEHNRAFDLLRSHGYRIVTVSGGYDGAALRTADEFLDSGRITELEAALITNSLVRRTWKLLDPQAFPQQTRERVRWNLNPDNWLPSLIRNRGTGAPTFMFVHVPSPHSPYVFRRDGGPTVDPDLSVLTETLLADRTPEMSATLARAYADQLAYVDSLTLDTVDEILLQAPSNTVVIVMSDHGPSVHIDWAKLNVTDTRERFGNFFAARTPGVRGLFGDRPTLVNLFPTLLNHYLATDLPAQSDSSFTGIAPHDLFVDIGNPDED